MLKGLKALHDRGILHRDIKSANIFLSKNENYIKLGDLNLSKVVKNKLTKTQTGTPYYASPEIYNNQPYGVKSDIWSLGCVIYEITTLKPPFLAKNILSLASKIKKGVF
jgi:NIMA (never in mitosis gene a)-related kinase